MPPPMPPPASLGPLSTRLIKVVPRRTSSCSSFSQLQVDGQDDIGMGGSDCSETGGVEDVPPTTPLAPLQPPSPKTPPINEAGFKSPAHKSPVGVTGVTGLHSDPSVTCSPSEKVAGFEGQEFNDVSVKVEAAAEVDAVSTPERCYRPVERARERRKLRLEGSQRSSVLSAWERVYLRCEQCNNKFTDLDWSKFKSEGMDVEIVKHCSTCIDSMARALLQSTRPHEFTDVE